MQKVLTRSSYDKKIAGVCGGIAQYFNIDPSIIRLLAVILIFAGGTGILAYFIAVIIIPIDYQVYGPNPYQQQNEEWQKKHPQYTSGQSQYNTTANTAENAEQTQQDYAANQQAPPYTDNSQEPYGAQYPPPPQKQKLSATKVLGIILVCLGMLFAAAIFFPRFNFGVIFAIGVVIAGIAIIIKGSK